MIWGEQGTLTRFVFTKGAHVSRHRHDVEQHTCLLSGAMRIELDGREVRLHADEVLVIPGGIEHEVWFVEDSVVLDFFAPPRHDWREGRHQYLAGR